MNSMITMSPRAIALGAVVALATGALLVSSVATRQDVHAADSNTAVPTSRVMEATAGIRVLSAHSVGDGGIIDLRYQVLDASKASIVEGDVTKTPQITDVDSGAVLHDTAAMRHGHAMRPAGEYFLLYYNQGGSVKPGDFINVSIDGVTLNDVPVT
ncbi:MAG: hypothetical protein WCI29_05505 [Actinomycetes bacterium]|jgi:hypothetical protein